MTFAPLDRTTRSPLRAQFDHVAEMLRAARARHRAFNQTFQELDRMTDRELADIGVHRTEIGGIARQAAQRI